MHPLIENVELKVGDVLCEAGNDITFAIFPSTGVISLAASGEEDAALQLGIVGRDGMFGIPLSVGQRRSAVRAVVHGNGLAQRIRAQPFRRALESCPALHARLHVYTHALLTQVTETALCNASHSIEGRSARSMLQLSDRLGSATFELTQQELADMLGVRRPAVCRAARALLRAGLVRYSRGRVEIVDHRGLEAMACRCYGGWAGRC